MTATPELMAVFNLPFAEQEAFFRTKLNIPTRRWTDLWKEQHAKGFMVAGAYKADLLADFREAVDKAISKGTTLAEFRKDFDRIVAKHGWSYNGSRNWRSEVIYNTNIRQAYNAARWKQLTDPDVLKAFPYIVYRHGDSRVPRPLHLSWDGVTLPPDDPWWKTHAPQNGWGCRCKAFGATKGEYEAAAKKTAPDDGYYTPTDKQGRPFRDPATGKVEQLPNGIDRGFDYNPGEAAFGKSWARETGEVKELGPWRRAEYPQLPKKLRGDKPSVKLGPRLHVGDEAALRAAVPEGVYQDKLGSYVQVTPAVAEHILEKPETRWDGREQYFPLIPNVIENPQEVWVGFIQSIDSGRVYLRRRYVKAYEIGKGRVVGVLADTVKEQLVAFDILRSEDPTGGRLRSGRLIYPED